MSNEERAQYRSFDRREEETREKIDRESLSGGTGGLLERMLRKSKDSQAVAGASVKPPAIAPDPGKDRPANAEAPCKTPPPASDPGTVFEAELEAIYTRRALNGMVSGESSDAKEQTALPSKRGVAKKEAALASEAAFPAFERAKAQYPTTQHKLTGLCLSGGGLRSAAFSMGAMQALYFQNTNPRPQAASPSDLPMIDYLSTVSGGGYIGASLSLGMTRSKGKFPFGNRDDGSTETLVTRHLRDNSRYLLAGGIVSFLFVYLRGVIAGLMCILPPLVGIAALMALVFTSPERLTTPPWAYGWLEDAYKTSYVPLISYTIGYVLVLLAVLAIGVSLVKPFGSVTARRRFTAMAGVVLGLPLAAALLLEVHPALLRAYFVADGALIGPGIGAQVLAVSPEKLRDWAQNVVPFLFVASALMLPFIKQIAEAAAQTTQKTYGGKIAAVLSRAALPLLAAIVPFLLWLLMMTIAITMIKQGYFLFEDGKPVVWMMIAALVFAFSFFLIDYNANSLHNIYRDRMSRAFLVSSQALEQPDSKLRREELDKDDRMALSKISTDYAPYHLINTALNIPGSPWANQRGRNADFFIYSPKFIGGELTGYINTGSAEMKVSTFNLGSAMAVSGAAIAPNMGMLSVRLMSITLAVLNLRLGRWAANPRRLKEGSLIDGLQFPGARHFLREAFNKTGIGTTDNGKGEVGAAVASGADKPFVYLSDGGHIENLGVYELLRRRCRLIISVDGERDPDISAGALAQLERFARIDLGIRLSIDVTPIAIGHAIASKAMSKETEPLKLQDAEAGPHVALGLIEYPAVLNGAGAETGVLLYVKSSLSGDENSYIAAYKADHPAFPHETTGDQFFTEEQFECYRALGEHILRRALKGQDDVTWPMKATTAAQRHTMLKLVQETLPGAKIRPAPRS